MRTTKTLGVLSIVIAILSAVAAAFGIFYTAGNGNYSYETIRGETVIIYGKGLYHHMSADVAIQGIAQDYITLFIAVPLLLISFIMARKGGYRSRLVYAGTVFYLLVTYLFYTTMGMFNFLFLVYVALLATTFFALSLVLLSFDIPDLKKSFSVKAPTKFAAGFLVFCTVAIAMLWLSVVVPPLMDGTIYPVALQHYTTLIVQGLDLGLLLPLGFVAGILLLKNRPLGFLLVPVYLIFLSILMTALLAKIIAMAMNGVNVIPSVYIIPAFDVLAIISAVLLLKSIKKKEKILQENKQILEAV